MLRRISPKKRSISPNKKSTLPRVASPTKKKTSPKKNSSLTKKKTNSPLKKNFTKTLIEKKQFEFGQFQTDDLVSERLVKTTMKFLLHPKNQTIFIEPSAGMGSFCKHLPKNTICIDIDASLKKKFPHYYISDFLHITPEMIDLVNVDPSKVVVIGNPPFSASKKEENRARGIVLGGSKNMALHFINHASTMADTVAFVLGLNFRRPSIRDRINPELHLVYEEILSSRYNTEFKTEYKLHDKNVNTIATVFQIWQRKYDKNHTPILRDSYYGDCPEIKKGIWYHRDGKLGEFQFVYKEQNPNLGVRRWGGAYLIGDLITDPDQIQELIESSRNTWYEWLYVDPKKYSQVVKRLQSLKPVFHEHMTDISSTHSVKMNRQDLLKIYLDETLQEDL